MFTGIIEATAKVIAQGSSRLTLERPGAFDDVKLGSSISVSGVCLTVAAMDARSLTFDVMPETVRITTIGDWTIGDLVNLERALPAHGRFEGHVVQGHAEATGEVTGLEKRGSDVRLTVRVPAEMKRVIVPKGSICLDGVSLTVADAANDFCTVALIPMTLQSTTLGTKRMGDRVNIETDILVRTLLASR
ncbi:MAG: riboflavin synthase [Candidatus Peribacter sp.]|nr:riboflavin synthase [Candidatus Peribacter sp.]